MQSTKQFDEATHVARHGGETIYFTVESFTDVCDALVKKYGGTPDVRKISTAAAKTNGGNGTAKAAPEPPPEPEQKTQPSNPSPPVQDKQPVVEVKGAPESGDPADNIEGGQMDETGRDRSVADYEALVGAGFSPAQTAFERGLRVVGLGVQNATSARNEFDNMELVTDYCGDFKKRIVDENRRTEIVTLNDLRLLKNGDLRLPDGTRITLDTHSFGQLCRRAGPELGSGVNYLQQCWPNLRSRDVNNWLKYYQDREQARQCEYDKQADGISEKRARKLYGKRPEETTAKLLLRDNENHQSGTEMYGLVSEKYANDFGVDTIAEGIMRTKGVQNARGMVRYDGRRAQFQVLYHTTTKPEHFVAGEFFRVGIQIKTDDTGSGSCQVDAVAFQNLCLNLIIIDRAITRIANIKHIGDPVVLAKKFEEAMAKAMKSLDHFVKQWGYAVEEDVIQRTADVTPDHAAELMKVHSGGLPISVALPGLFNGLFTHNRELVPVRAGHPNSQKRHDLIRGLVDMYEKDESSAKQGDVLISRASIANALTRYAHEGQSDPWQEDVFQRAAGNLLVPRVKPTKANPNPLPPPIPYEPFDLQSAAS